MPTSPHYDGLSGPGSGSVVAIGNFDGVHRGHQQVVREAIGRAREIGVPMVVLTFDPHPAKALGRPVPAPLTTLERRVELLERLGVDRVAVQHFDEAFAALTPEQFAQDLLVETLAARVVVVGQNFRFGHARTGDFGRLADLGREGGFEVSSFELAGDARGPFSSTRVRDALGGGDVADATHVLGRPHAFTGVVGRGAQRGRTLGFPTANVEDVVELVPARGVYAVRANGVLGVMNVGVRPTVEAAGRLTVEVHLLDFTGDLYGAPMRVELVARLRDERKFASLDELKAQIAQDVERTRALA